MSLKETKKSTELK